ncbi:alpha/beta hydrolase [Sphingorhabdus lutea]|uniref:Alpha/beta hydrolase n=1 Tax=Sphingorhabdus lutea TaxID=1913578 RepID=A0A1L3JDE6_9SPHN|nr:alpha/beta hydrolase [Sphingorhabdus lutea]APG63152.1 alpha/beta hydrolase [Sphingorhabdus lutea]
MDALPQRKIALSTGITLNIAEAGDAQNPPIIFLHGFPESHRTWRHQFNEFSNKYHVIAPDQRGFAGSDKPQNAAQYKVQHLVGDIIALADALGLDKFILCGHDWGGAVAWAATLTCPDRVEKLVIANAPHPFTYQKSLFDDLEQRAAAQYITAFRNPQFEKYVAQKGWEAYFQENFADHVEGGVPDGEREIYLSQWRQQGCFTAMMNWYRASKIIVPPMPDSGEPMPERPAYLDAPFMKVAMPTLLIWAMDDHALKPSLLHGLDELIDDLTLVKLSGGHFVPWENHDAVTRAMQDWLK